MFALSDARDYSFSKVPYLEREEKITDQSNSRKVSELSKLETRKFVEILSRKLAHHPLGVSGCTLITITIIIIIIIVIKIICFININITITSIIIILNINMVIVINIRIIIAIIITTRDQLELISTPIYSRINWFHPYSQGFALLPSNSLCVLKMVDSAAYVTTVTTVKSNHI